MFSDISLENITLGHNLQKTVDVVAENVLPHDLPISNTSSRGVEGPKIKQDMSSERFTPMNNFAGDSNEPSIPRTASSAVVIPDELIQHNHSVPETSPGDGKALPSVHAGDLQEDIPFHQTITPRELRLLSTAFTIATFMIALDGSILGIPYPPSKDELLIKLIGR